MKTILFAAALSVSGIALAQTQPSTGNQTQPPSTGNQMTQPSTGDQMTQPRTGNQMTQQPSGQTVDDPSQATGPQGVTQQGTDPNGQATPPAGMNQMPAQGTSPMMGNSSNMAMAPRAATTNYPPCSRTVTDSCVQTYERGVRRGSRRR